MPSSPQAPLVASALSLHLQQYARLLDEGTPEALDEAADVARACIELNNKHPEGYELLGKALCLQGRHNDAVTWYKKGLWWLCGCARWHCQGSLAHLVHWLGVVCVCVY